MHDTMLLRAAPLDDDGLALATSRVYLNSFPDYATVAQPDRASVF